MDRQRGGWCQSYWPPHCFPSGTMIAGGVLLLLLFFKTAESTPDRHLVRMQDLLAVGFDRHILRLHRPGMWGPRRTRSRRSPGGGQQKFPTEVARGRSRGGADTEAVRFLSPGVNSKLTCGRPALDYKLPNFNRMPRIRNGTCTPYGAFPWTVQIQVLCPTHS